MSRHGRFGVWTGVVVMAVMLGALATAVTAAEQRAWRGPGWGGPEMARGGPAMGVGRGLGQLGLTAEQREQVKAIRQAHQDEFKALADRGLPARRALADAIAAGDEAAIRKASADLASVQTDRALLAAKVHEEIFKILTPEQQQKAKELRETAQQRQEQRRGRRLAPRG